MLPLAVYEKATGDSSLSHFIPAQIIITAYGEHKIHTAIVTLDYKLIDINKIQPLLGRKVCRGMKMITYFDNDGPDTKGAAVFN